MESRCTDVVSGGCPQSRHLFPGTSPGQDMDTAHLTDLSFPGPVVLPFLFLLATNGWPAHVFLSPFKIRKRPVFCHHPYHSVCTRYVITATALPESPWGDFSVPLLWERQAFPSTMLAATHQAFPGGRQRHTFQSYLHSPASSKSRCM